MRARVRKHQELKRLMVRLPRHLHEYIVEAATQGGRSLNYEVITRLESSIELDRLLRIKNSDEALRAMAKLKRRLVDLRLPDGDE